MTDAPPPKLIRLPALAAAALAAITTAVLGSFLGTAGTLAGAGLASAVGGIATALYERGIERAAAKARAGRAITPKARERAKRLASRKVVLRSIAGAAGIAAVTLGVITATEYAAGRPVSALVQDTHGSGLSVTGGGSGPLPVTSPVPAPAGSGTPSPSPARTSPGPATATPVPTPPARVTRAPSASRTATTAGTAPPAATPSASATPAPTASPSPGSAP